MALTNEELKWATILALTEPPQRNKPWEPPEPPIVTPYLTFHSYDGEFSLSVYDGKKHWDGILEYSNDAVNWIEWTGTYISSNNGYLYIRGSGNSHIVQVSTTYTGWQITGMSDQVYCSGNIETLLDYSLVINGEHPNMTDYCYYYLFYDCKKLISAPDLPAINLTEGCYMGMFRRCTGLIIAPKLPSTNLARACYTEMFEECTSLATIPKLPATTLAMQCYAFMFMFCSSLRISNTSSTEYPYSYRIPTIGTVADVPGLAVLSMFSGTGGPFTGTPTINTTYYTDHEPV